MFSVIFLSDLIIILKKMYVIKIIPMRDKIDIKKGNVKFALKKLCICSKLIFILLIYQIFCKEPIGRQSSVFIV